MLNALLVAGILTLSVAEPTGASWDVITLAGTGNQRSGPDGPADSTDIVPVLLEIGSQPNEVIFTDSASKIRRITTDSQIITLAGTGNQGSSPDGPALNTDITPAWFVVDPSSNEVIFVDGLSKIRKITVDNQVVTLAGTGNQESNPDGPALSTDINPWWIAIDPRSNEVIFRDGKSRIRKITEGNQVVTLAGTGNPGSSPDGPALNTDINPNTIAVDPRSNEVIFTDGLSKIRKITGDNQVVTLAGTGNQGSTPDGPALNTDINPTWVGFDSWSNEVIFTDGVIKIRKVTADHRIVTLTDRDWPSPDGLPGIRAIHSFTVVIDTRSNKVIFNDGDSTIWSLVPWRVRSLKQLTATAIYDEIEDLRERYPNLRDLDTQLALGIPTGKILEQASLTGEDFQHAALYLKRLANLLLCSEDIRLCVSEQARRRIYRKLLRQSHPTLENTQKQDEHN